MTASDLPRRVRSSSGISGARRPFRHGLSLSRKSGWISTNNRRKRRGGKRTGNGSAPVLFRGALFGDLSEGVFSGIEDIFGDDDRFGSIGSSIFGGSGSGSSTAPFFEF